MLSPWGFQSQSVFPWTTEAVQPAQQIEPWASWLLYLLDADASASCLTIVTRHYTQVPSTQHQDSAQAGFE